MKPIIIPSIRIEIHNEKSVKEKNNQKHEDNVEDIGNDIKKEREKKGGRRSERREFLSRWIHFRKREKKNGDPWLGEVDTVATRVSLPSRRNYARRKCEMETRTNRKVREPVSCIATLDLPFVINILFCTSINIACLMGGKRKKKGRKGNAFVNRA